MSWRCLRIGLVWLGLAALAAGRANAEETAKEHFDRGTAAYALGRFADAALEYERAFELKQDPALLYNAAQAHRMGGNKKRALFLYQSYLHVFGQRVQKRDEIKRRIAELKQALADEAEAEERSERAPAAAASARPAPTPTPPPTPPPEPRVEPAAPQPAPALVATPMPPPAPLHKRRAWVWGVVAGSVVAVGLGVGLGLGLGLPSASAADPPFGRVTLR